MEIQLGIQSNCSEPVSQICGITKINVEQLKDNVRKALSFKYKEEYLNEYLDKLLQFDGKFCLTISDSIEEYETIAKEANKIDGMFDACVSSCSDPIDNDEQMERYIEYRNKKEE